MCYGNFYEAHHPGITSVWSDPPENRSVQNEPWKRSNMAVSVRENGKEWEGSWESHQTYEEFQIPSEVSEKKEEILSGSISETALIMKVWQEYQGNLCVKAAYQRILHLQGMDLL